MADYSDAYNYGPTPPSNAKLDERLSAVEKSLARLAEELAEDFYNHNSISVGKLTTSTNTANVNILTSDQQKIKELDATVSELLAQNQELTERVEELQNELEEVTSDRDYWQAENEDSQNELADTAAELERFEAMLDEVRSALN